MLRKIIFTAAAVALAMTIHEFVRAITGTRLNDPTPREQGRISLNPLKHIEPVGFICMLILGYGWSKPAEANENFYTDRIRGTLTVNLTPSLVNIIAGIILAMAARAAYVSTSLFPGAEVFLIKYVVTGLYYLARANIGLALSNIIPVYPFDGEKILYLYLSAEAKIKFTLYRRYFQILMFFLLAAGIVGWVFDPVCDSLLNFVGYEPL